LHTEKELDPKQGYRLFFCKIQLWKF
jgi:hypothetical protein